MGNRGALSAILTALALAWAVCGAAQEGPRSVPVQIALAEAMAENEDWEEAARRWIGIIYYFGPSEQEARAEFELGAVALPRGRSDLAVSQWQEVVARHPDTEWAARAREALALLGKEPPEPEEAPEPYITEETPGDERQFLMSEAGMAQGLYAFALRDYLKVPNLHPDSPRAAEARFRVGTCQVLLGRPELAVRQWQRLLEEHPDAPEARLARGGIAAWQALLEVAGVQVGRQPGLDGGWTPFRAHGTEPDRGLSYAEDLYENGIYDYALQEYAKVLCGIYTPPGEDNPHLAYARYRMGVCAYRLRDPDGAARQWRRVMEDHPDSPWAQQASRALAAVGGSDTLSSEAGRPALALPEGLDTPLAMRQHLAHQLADAGLPRLAIKEYLKVINVLTAGRPNPYQAEAWYRIGQCQQALGRPDLAAAAWEAAVREHAGTEWAERAEAALAAAGRREGVFARGRGGPGT